MKRYIQILCCFMSAALLTSCAGFQKSSLKDFDAYTAELIPQMISEDSSVINSLYENPQNYGITPKTYEHGFMTLADFEEALADDEAVLETLKKYDSSQMNQDQKITYDLLWDYVENDLMMKDKYYLINNNFDVNRGVHAGLTLDLYFYSFRNKQDIDSFIHLLTSLSDAFDKYVAFEKERQEKGYGMSKTYLNHVIEQVETFNQGSHEYLLDHALEQLKQADFLSDEEKEIYFSQIQEAYEFDLLGAYRKLESDLKALPKPKADYLSLADYEGGKEYYAYLIKKDTGFSDIEEYRDYLSEKKYQAMLSFILYMQMNEEVSKNVENGVFGASMTSLTSMQEVLEYLENMAFESDSFPAIPKLNYVMEVVPSSMQEIFLASAAYFLSPFDSDNTVLEHMVLNGEFDSDSYTTLAHEGIPGHMYQHNYFKQVEHNHLRDLLGNSGYQESWATYVAKYMTQYSEDPKMAWAMELNTNISYLYILDLDLMIHYDGISTQEALDYLMTNFGMDEANALAQYTQLIESPAVFVPYYGYYFRLMDLKEECMANDESLTEQQFHKMILDLGPLPYNLLEKYVNLEMRG